MAYWIGTKDSEYRSYKKMCFVHLVLLGDVRVRVGITHLFQFPRFFFCKSMLAGRCITATTESLSSYIYAYNAHQPIHGNE